MKLYLRLAAAAVTAVLLSGGSCSTGTNGFSGETPPVAVAENPQPASTPPATESAPAESPPSPPPADSSPAPSPAPSQPVTFTSFSAVQPNQTVVAPTVSNVAQFTAQQQGADWRITSFALESLNWHGSGGQLTYDAAGTLAGIRLEVSPWDTLDFQRSAGHSVSCSGLGTCRADNGTQDLILLDPTVNGWNYQTFGIWGTESLAASGRMGAVSIGAATPSNAVPTTGSATFRGIAAGFYSDAAGNPFATAATMSAQVNFAGRSIAFSTANTIISNGTTTSAPGLNLSGTLTYGLNTISGQVQTQNGALSGNADGRFYGPTANEIGGVYSLSGSGQSRMIGGFGGRR